MSDGDTCKFAINFIFSIQNVEREIFLRKTPNEWDGLFNVFVCYSTKQNRAEQNRTEQNRIEQNRTCDDGDGQIVIECDHGKLLYFEWFSVRNMFWPFRSIFNVSTKKKHQQIGMGQRERNGEL